MASMTWRATIFVALAILVLGEEVSPNAKATFDRAVGLDETKSITSQLTIAMSGEIVDERTFAIRDSSKGSRQVHLCLGNAGPTPRGSLDDGEYAEKIKVATEALGKLVDRQMIWYKAAPDAVQLQNSSDAIPRIVADVWSIEGKHINSLLKKEGHLADEATYESELAKDILTVASEQEKKESYKELEEALKESEKAKREAAKAAKAKADEEEAAENIESVGFAGWMGVAMLVLLVAGVATNFGRSSNKKTSLNRKRSALERFWMKLKGA